MVALAKEKGAPPMASGAPGERSCATSKCHASYDLNSGPAEITFKGLPEVAEVGKIYDLTLQLNQKGARSFGFQVTVADEAGNPLGTLLVTDEGTTQLVDPARYAEYSSRQYLTHQKNGVKAPKKGISQEWTFQWQAPAEGLTPAHFHLAVNAGDGNKKKTGDHIYTREFLVAAAE